MLDSTEDYDWTWLDQRLAWLSRQLRVSLGKLSLAAGLERGSLSAAGIRERRKGVPGSHNVESQSMQRLADWTGANLQWLVSGKGGPGQLREIELEDTPPPPAVRTSTLGSSVPAHEVVTGLQPVLKAAGIPERVWNDAIVRSLAQAEGASPWEISARAVTEGRRLAGLAEPEAQAAKLPESGSFVAARSLSDEPAVQRAIQNVKRGSKPRIRRRKNK